MLCVLPCADVLCCAQEKTVGGCGGYYLSMYERVYHSVRRPLGGTGCVFYPCYPPQDDLVQRLTTKCDQPLEKCEVDKCDPAVTRSPCANDTALACTAKRCPGKHM